MPSEIKYHCINPDCGMELWPLKHVDHNRKPPGVGDFLVCGACSTITIVTLSGTRAFTKYDKAGLAPDELKDLEFALRASARNVRNN